VDDNVDSAESAAKLLRLSGHNVRVALSGPEALNVGEVYHPEVVLLDIGLPGMNGYEVARQLRQRCGPRLLLIAATGYGQEEDLRLAVEAGFDHHLTKPVNFARLHDLLASCSLG
jgi:CheY-like chemotaxis protein